MNAKQREQFNRGGVAAIFVASGVALITCSAGFLKCSHCGGNLTIVSGYGAGRVAHYGCPKHVLRGVCSNALRERESVILERLLSGLQSEMLKPKVIEVAIAKVQRQLEDA